MTTHDTPTQVGREFVSFAAIGVVGFVVDASIFLLLNGHYGWPITAARTVSASCSIATTFALNRSVTFAGRRSYPWLSELARYVVAQGMGLLVNLGSFALALWTIPPLRATPIIALALGAAAALVFNFLSARMLVFRRDSHGSGSPRLPTPQAPPPESAGRTEPRPGRDS
jgi:putative flippase GtrA